MQTPSAPSGISASKEEKEAARRVAGMAMKKLMAMGFSEPVVADSGNGYHLLFKIHASVEERQVLADFLAVLDMWFSTDAVKIDTTVFNPARITKLYGTMARKGASTQERPHRRSYIIRAPQEIRETSMTLVRNIAAENRHMTMPADNPRQRSSGSFNLEQFLADHQVEVLKKIPISSGTKYPLAACPFDPSHKNGDAAVFAYSNGSFGFTASTTAAPAITGMNSGKRWIPPPMPTARTRYTRLRPPRYPSGSGRVSPESLRLLHRLESRGCWISPRFPIMTAARLSSCAPALTAWMPRLAASTRAR